MPAMDFPASPTLGQFYNRYTWDGIKWMLTPVGDGIGNGVVGFAKILATQGSITTIVDITGLSVTFNANPARTYKTTIFGNMFSSVANDINYMVLTDSANTQLQISEVSQGPTGAQGRSGICVLVETGLSGSVTRKVRGYRLGTGTAQLQASSTIPAFIVVEDITPSSGGPSSVGLFKSYHRRRLTTGATVPTAGVETKVPYGTEVEQIGVPLIAADGTITIPEDGLFSINAWTSVGPGATALSGYLRKVSETGAAWNYMSNSGAAPGGYANVSVSVTEFLRAGATLNFKIAVTGTGFGWNESSGYSPSMTVIHHR